MCIFAASQNTNNMKNFAKEIDSLNAEIERLNAENEKLRKDKSDAYDELVIRNNIERLSEKEIKRLQDEILMLKRYKAPIYEIKLHLDSRDRNKLMKLAQRIERMLSL